MSFFAQGKLEKGDLVFKVPWYVANEALNAEEMLKRVFGQMQHK